MFSFCGLLLCLLATVKPQYSDSIGSPSHLALSSLFWGALACAAFWAPSPKQLRGEAKAISMLLVVAVIVIVSALIVMRAPVLIKLFGR